MNNIIASDFYRVRRGAALRNTVISVLALVLLLAGLIALTQTQATVVPEGMSAAEAAQMEQDMAEAAQEFSIIENNAAFGKEILSQSFIMLLFLPIAIAVFCADFSAGTYRNTLSYESGRSRIYLAKLALSAVLSLALVAAMILFSWLAGGVTFGFGGFSGAYFADILTTLVLQLPIFLATVAVCHCLIALTKKSSSTIAIFLVGYIALAIIAQLVASSIPGMEWAILLDPQSGGKVMAMRDAFSAAEVAFVLIYNLAVAAVATIVGVLHFRKADMP